MPHPLRMSVQTLRLWLLAVLLPLGACAPQREFVRFEDAGIFHPGRDAESAPADYDSIETTLHGVPNHGIPPMYAYPRW